MFRLLSKQHCVKQLLKNGVVNFYRLVTKNCGFLMVSNYRPVGLKCVVLHLEENIAWKGGSNCSNQPIDR